MIVISIFFTILFPRLLLSLVSIEKIHQTLEMVFIIFLNTSNFVKNTPLRVIFSTLFSVFGNVMKQCLSCLIYYFKCSDCLFSINFFKIWVTYVNKGKSVNRHLFIIEFSIVRSVDGQVDENIRFITNRFYV